MLSLLWKGFPKKERPNMFPPRSGAGKRLDARWEPVHGCYLLCESETPDRVGIPQKISGVTLPSGTSKTRKGGKNGTLGGLHILVLLPMTFRVGRNREEIP